MSKPKRFWYLSHQRTRNAQVSLCKDPDSPEPLPHAFIKYGCRCSFRPNFRPLAALDMSACVFEGDFLAYAITAPKLYELFHQV